MTPLNLNNLPFSSIYNDSTGIRLMEDDLPALAQSILDAIISPTNLSHEVNLIINQEDFTYDQSI
ncbi:MAG: hypothetical protein CBD86_03315 [Gammaproteobacteria bacterium TMED226]|nr:MAG: hypothetical protein CBD86_03315 [Gammaproteobacteria bacterium TMED226]|tara:strand:- start:791 stop:985 length:195 start_codon:yes stop_codon:yes gene_type:complete